MWELCKTRIKKSSPDTFIFMKFRPVMTWSLTLVGLPSAGEISKHQNYIKKIQKMKVLPKAWVSLINRLNISDQKLKTFTFSCKEQNKGNTNPKSNTRRWTL